MSLNRDAKLAGRDEGEDNGLRGTGGFLERREGQSLRIRIRRRTITWLKSPIGRI